MNINFEKEFFKNVPERYRLCSLENCQKIDTNLIEFGRAWAKKLDSSLFVFGTYGTGKTHFAFALLREALRNWQGLWPRYYTSPNLDSQLLKNVRGEEGDLYLIEKLAEIDLLFIDDIGRETKTDRLKRQYFEIINQRYCNGKPTILTSNYSLETLGELLDGAVASRIQEWQNIEMGGIDLRKSE